MTLETLKRVMWRLEGNKQQFTRTLEQAIFKEVGTDHRTVTKNIAVLLKLGWIKRTGRYTWETCQENVY